QSAMTLDMIDGYRLDPGSKMVIALGEAPPPPLKPKLISFVCASCKAANQVETINGKVSCEYCGTPYIAGH
ncbi:MAG: hypothetical protein HQK55_12035, partial [Deltaproteobacteria bacterium]|nr:hypothetical protein [Deltaproteobacteria bacterium]